ncbi:hypothetical protein Hhel01_01564 [Haloferula helveola]
MIATASASEVLWAGKGAVSTVGGTGFTGVAAEDEVEIQLAYDSDALVDDRSFLVFDGAVAGRAWFYGQVNLAVTVRIGELTWAGTIANIPDGTSIMESVCWDFGGNPDRFTVILDAERGGSFPSFPYSGVESARELKIEFLDSTSPAELFDVHVLPDGVANICEMTSASGSIRAGSDLISFVIDPKSVRVSQPRVPVVLTRTAGGLQFEWETEIGTSYRLESSSDLWCWVIEDTVGGTGLTVQRNLNPFGTYFRRFYRVVEL